MNCMKSNYFNDIFKPSRKILEIKKLLQQIILILLIRRVIKRTLIVYNNYSADFNNFEAEKMYEKFSINYNNFNGKPFITNYLLDNYNNVYYPHKILSENDYLENDIHLNKNGNAKLAEFAINILKNNN